MEVFGGWTWSIPPDPGLCGAFWTVAGASDYRWSLQAKALLFGSLHKHQAINYPLAATLWRLLLLTATAAPPSRCHFLAAPNHSATEQVNFIQERSFGAWPVRRGGKS
jgi:hypothetical protein